MEKTFEKMLTPVKELNDLTLKSIAQIAEMQVKLVKEHTDISIDALKSANQIKDIDTLQKYLQGQITVAQNLSDKAVEEAQEVAKLSETYVDKVRQLVEKSVGMK